MTKRIFGLVLALFLGFSSLSARANLCGLGFVVIEPTGLTGKIWWSKTTALDAAIGWSPLSGHHLHLHADYFFYRFSIHADTRVDFSLYLGAGGKIIFREHDNAWFRFPFGVDFLSKKSPVNVFFEVAPAFNFSELDLVGAIGLRYTFSR